MNIFNNKIFGLSRLKRLLGWQFMAVLLLVLIALVSPQQLTVVIYKISLITLAAVLGYWLDRSLFPKATPGQYLEHSPDLVFAAALIRRAIIVAAVCLAVAMGL
ncbi:putative holin [Candidatus Symbiopectobacterium sp. NZEC127]|uniref:putative holin n=1 Tax=Candidatus Symbiopectobacterium sp. NZEC127 TaxID=2820472 RepID=UPI00222716B3|nr:putative holin [Candidatus Symbiopectobacterium sp. NZEC127]MCW2488895.1 putative holin [Candidatus Symbiopectobacterium sp. NZEC127]